MKKNFRKGNIVRLKHIRNSETAKILSFEGRDTERCAVLDKKLSISNIWNLDFLEKVTKNEKDS